MFDLVIIGAGPVGISVAYEAERAGLDYVVIEKFTEALKAMETN